MVENGVPRFEEIRVLDTDAAAGTFCQKRNGGSVWFFIYDIETLVCNELSGPCFVFGYETHILDDICTHCFTQKVKKIYDH